MILVLGATGRLGLAFVRRLRERGRGGDRAGAADHRRESGQRRPHRARRPPRPRRLREVCDGVQTVVATASMIVPRPGDCADYDAIADGYAELGRVARAAGVERFVFMSARAS